MNIKIVITALERAIAIKIDQLDFWVINNRDIKPPFNVIRRVDHGKDSRNRGCTDYVIGFQDGRALAIELCILRNIRDEWRIGCLDNASAKFEGPSNRLICLFVGNIIPVGLQQRFLFSKDIHGAFG